MTKILCTITFLGLMITNNGQAQNKIYGGVKISPNYSIITDKVDKLKSGIGYGFGYFEVLELENKINLQAEINYVNNTFISDQSSGTIKKTITTNNNSIEIPFMIKYRPSDNFSIGLGYHLSFIPSTSEKTKETGMADSKIDQDGIKSNGFFLDANAKTSKAIIGLRILKTNKSLIDPLNSINASFYVGFAIF